MEYLASLQDTIAKGMEEVSNIDMNQILDLDSMLPQHSLDTTITEIESQDQFNNLLAIKGPKVLIFGAKWCKNCPILVKGVVESDPVRAQRNVQYVKIDADEFPEISDEYAASTLPFSVFVHSNGSIVGKYKGSDIKEFEKHLEVFTATSVADIDLVTLKIAQSAASAEPPVQPVLPTLRMVPLGRNKAVPFFPKKEASLKSGSGNFNRLLTSEMLYNLGLPEVPFCPSDFLNLNTHVQDCFNMPAPVGGFTLEDIVSLYTFDQPTVSADGTCSNVEVMADKRFNLAIDAYSIPGVQFAEAAVETDLKTSKDIFPDGRPFNVEALLHHPMTLRLYRLRQLVQRIEEFTKADWIGIYRMNMARTHDAAAAATTTTTKADDAAAAAAAAGVENNSEEFPALLKESYFGEPSRAVFPVTKEFAVKSTNSWVAIFGNVRLIRNTNQREDGVSYYKCSGRVQSELCLPILQQVTVLESDSIATTHFQVVGIIDLESWKLDHFSSRMIAELLKIGFDLANIDFGGFPI